MTSADEARTASPLSAAARGSSTVSRTWSVRSANWYDSNKNTTETDYFVAPRVSWHGCVCVCVWARIYNNVIVEVYTHDIDLCLCVSAFACVHGMKYSGS